MMCTSTHLTPFPDATGAHACRQGEQPGRRPSWCPSCWQKRGTRVAVKASRNFVRFACLDGKSLGSWASRSSRTLPPFCQQGMRSNAWTTVPEFDFLNDLVPKFLSQQDIRVVGPWLAELTTAFFEKFPSRSAQFDRDRLTKVCFIFAYFIPPSHSFCVEIADVVRESHPRLRQGNRCSPCSRPLWQGQPPTAPLAVISSILRALLS